MPSSHTDQINEIMKLVILTSPKSILDVGVGFGKYGVLSREYLENRDVNKQYSFDWKIRIDGIEGWKDYFSSLYEFAYDHVYNDNALKILEKLELRYDLVLLIDVLEHFEFQNGLKILEL